MAGASSSLFHFNIPSSSPLVANSLFNHTINATTATDHRTKQRINEWMDGRTTTRTVSHLLCNQTIYLQCPILLMHNPLVDRWGGSAASNNDQPLHIAKIRNAKGMVINSVCRRIDSYATFPYRSITMLMDFSHLIQHQCRTNLSPNMRLRPQTNILYAPTQLQIQPLWQLVST